MTTFFESINFLIERSYRRINSPEFPGRAGTTATFADAFAREERASCARSGRHVGHFAASHPSPYSTVHPAFLGECVRFRVYRCIHCGKPFFRVAAPLQPIVFFGNGR